MAVSRGKGGEEGLQVLIVINIVIIATITIVIITAQVLKEFKDRSARRVHRDHLECPLLFTTTKNPKQMSSTVSTTSRLRQWR